MSKAKGVRALAIVAVRNESVHISRCLRDLCANGLDVILLDNESTDDTVEQASKFLGDGLLSIESLPWCGSFSLEQQLAAKAAIIKSATHDWVIHADADEGLAAPEGYHTLLETISDADASGFNCVNFNEFVFLPAPGEDFAQEHYAERMTRYYFYSPVTPHLMRAWKRTAGFENLSGGGHFLHGGEVRLFPIVCSLRHYIILSEAHFRLKYFNRKFLDKEIEKGWHVDRTRFSGRSVTLPPLDSAPLKVLPEPSSRTFDINFPVDRHFWEWGDHFAAQNAEMITKGSTPEPATPKAAKQHELTAVPVLPLETSGTVAPTGVLRASLPERLASAMGGSFSQSTCSGGGDHGALLPSSILCVGGHSKTVSTVEGSMLDWSAILTQFPAWEGSAEPDSYRDFLGVRTRLKYYPPDYEFLAGTVQGIPGPDRAGLHDVAEWAGVLQSVLEAERQFVCVELGAGYGPFVVGSAIAARRRGIIDIRLIAVEGSRARAEWIQEHMRDNGIDPDQHTITRGVIGTFDGFAQFPVLDDNPVKSDAEPDFAAASQENMERVPSYTMRTILKGLKFVNIIHFDVQGGEADLIRNSLPILTEKCRRMVIGTHSLTIEDDLRSMLTHSGWAIEADEACKLSPEGRLAHDGVQVWRNDQVSSTYPDEPQAWTFSGLLRRIFAGS